MDSIKNGIIAGVVALAVAVGVVFLFWPSQPAAPAQPLGYTQSNIGEFPEGAKIGDAGARFVAVSIPAGQNQWSYRNTSGRVQYVTLSVLRTTGTASTTQTLTVGTSTASTFNSFSVPVTIKSLLNLALATTSVATTTNSLQGAGAQSGAGAGVAVLQSGEYLNAGIYQTYGNACTGSVCEAATSTNRGFNVLGFVVVIQP